MTEDIALEKDKLRKLADAFEKDDHRWCLSQNIQLEDTKGYLTLTEYAGIEEVFVNGEI